MEIYLYHRRTEMQPQRGAKDAKEATTEILPLMTLTKLISAD